MPSTSPQLITSGMKSHRRTEIKTFRLYRDQLDFIEHTNGDCSSFFMRYLLDLWIQNKIPDDLKKEFYRMRKELREKAELEATKQLLLNNLKAEESEDAKI